MPLYVGYNMTAASLLDALGLQMVALTGQKEPLGERGVVYLTAG